MNNNTIKYAFVIPVKDEEKLIGLTLKSCAYQTVKPIIVAAVDDGSTDNTAKIIKQFSKEYDFVHYVKLDTNNDYKVGKRVVNVFNVGQKYIEDTLIDYDWIIKLDSDISFGPYFMENLFSKIDGKNYGIVSGTPYYFENGTRYFDYSPDFHSHGQFKLYNAKCLKEIGGLDKSLGWDCADNIRAIDKGWKTAAFTDLHYQMHRLVGTKVDAMRGRFNSGQGAYVLCYSPAYMFLKLAHDATKSTGIKGSWAYYKGYRFAKKQHDKQLFNKKQARLFQHLMWDSFDQRLKENQYTLFQKNTEKPYPKWKKSVISIFYSIFIQLIRLFRPAKNS